MHILKSPLTQGRELKQIADDAYIERMQSPLTQGRELKLDELRRIREVMVAPHAGA